MSKIRVYQVAKDLNVSSKDIISKLGDIKIVVNNHMSTLEDNEVALVNKMFNKNDKKSPAKESKTPAPKAAPKAVEQTKTAAKATENANSPAKPVDTTKPAAQAATDKKPSWTVGTPKVNRPKRKSDYSKTNQNRPTQNRSNYKGNSNRPKTKVELQLESIKNQVPVKQPEKKIEPKKVETPVQKPVQTTPVQTTNNATASNNRPASSNNRPASSNNRPASSNNRPASSNNRPASSNNRPASSNNRPASSNNRPASSNNRPASSNNRPASSNNRPASSNNRPASSNNRPASSNNRPASSNNRPASSNNRPASSNNRPASNTSRPNTNSSRPYNKPAGNSTGQIGSTLDGKKPVSTKKKKKKDLKPVYDRNASLETKFSKKTKGKKRRRVEKAIDNSKYYNEDNILMVPERVTVAKFSEMLDETVSEVIMKLMAAGIMANVNQEIAYETAELIAVEFDIETEMIIPVIETVEIINEYFADDDAKDLINRPPVVTVMGHVDHGKTSLLDAIRETAVTDKEAGGITQHIGASEAMINGQKIVFLDTPGHEAFTTLRARGAQVTDIAVLVVAADDGVMPQTIEAIDHAKAAGVPIIVAINKIDKVGNNPDQVKKELSEHGLLVEDWGGDVISVEVSALKKINIEGLLEMILLQSEVLELKANPNRAATGTIIDAKVEKGRGVVTTLLVQNGTLSIGNSIVCGSAYGRVRAVFNHLGKRVKKAGPSTGVEITGLTEVPVAGDRFFVAEDDKAARQIAEKKQIEERNIALKGTPQHVTLEDIFEQIQAGKAKEIKIVLKADVQGSLEALKTSLLKVSHEEVAVNVIHAAVGTITESDVSLASASNAIIIGFNVRPITVVEQLAIQEGVELKTYRIIYEAINDISDALIGMLDPEFKEEVLGKIEVRQVIKVPNIGAIAGGYVLTGKVTRSAEFRLIREGIVVHEGKISSLRRFKDDVKEVAKGYECGIGFENYNDMKESDIIEAYHMVEIKRKK